MNEGETMEETVEQKLDKKTKISYYIVCFFILCVIGWFIELVELMRLGRLVNRGFLYGPYLPIYAIGGFFIYFLLNKLMKKKIPLWKINLMPVVIYIAMIIITGLVEYIGSWVLEIIFDRTWWDYSHESFNLHGRIVLRNLFLFAIAGMIYLYALEPYMKKKL
ncbi:MAG: putative ABC transporter permease, partial [Oscillospiraceae bacterium]|nr:putative ABC transporter permease [Oscillospiraceae bacterium]